MIPSVRERRSLRFRGTQNEHSDPHSIYVEQQTTMYQRKEKRLNVRYLCPPNSFFSSNWIPALWLFLALAYLALMTYLANTVRSNLPTPVSLENSSLVKDDMPRFIAARAQADLNLLIAMGPRPVGSIANEIQATKFLKDRIDEIRKQPSEAHLISTDDQVVSGSFYIDQKPVGYSSYYDKVQNIVVRLSSKSRNASTAVLINCHYDTVPGSPGASDDGFHCAVMLELLHVLYQSKSPFLHDIIFLFNGAEESGLQASHGFITQHKWAKDVKVFVNLEGCGAGGKEVLFQTGPDCPWLVETYRSVVPHPQGNVMGEELFQSGVIPSDTDFRIFRDFGRIPGVDFANIDNGFVYHTKFDNGKLVSLGSYQHTGDNMLALVQALANSTHVETDKSSPWSKESMVYFDFFGVWLVCYSKTNGTILNSVAVFLSVLTIAGLVLQIKKEDRLDVLEIFEQFIYAVLGTALGWVLSILYVYLLTLPLNWSKCTQSWYLSYWYQICMYYCSTLLFSILGPFTFFHQTSKLSRLQQSQLISVSTQLLWTVALLAGTIAGIRSSYIILILVLSATIGNAGLILYRTHTARIWIAVQLIQTAFPMLIAITHTIMAMHVFIPITNRSGARMDVELYIGILSAITCILITSFLVPLAMFVRHVSVIAVLATIHIIALIVVFITHPIPFYEGPSGDTGVLQRVPLWHVRRSLHNNTDSGIWMLSMDPSSPYHLKQEVTELQRAQNATHYCDKELFCALPFYSPRMTNFVPNSSWLKFGTPFNKSILHVEHMSESLASGGKRIHFEVAGPQEMGFMFSPQSGIIASGWSLEANLTASTQFNERPAYFVFYQRGLNSGSPWKFYIDFIHNNRRVQDNLYGTVTVGLSGSYIDSNNFTEDFRHFLHNFPNWAFLSPRASELKIWDV